MQKERSVKPVKLYTPFTLFFTLQKEVSRLYLQSPVNQINI